jgi:O-antigen ligase
MKNAGISHIRHTFFHTPDFDWQNTDRLINSVTNAGLTLVPLLDGNPNTQFTPVPDPNQFAQWAGEFALRYPNQLSAYIIWNEPNIRSHWGNQPVNPNEYAALLTATATAIRQNDPTNLIVLAPLAPTVETGPDNLADNLYLQWLYEVGAADYFDIVAGKPYGFDTPPSDRTVSQDHLNFSRIILLREVMERNGDLHKAVWAGNWGWNALPENWAGGDSIWGETTPAERAEWTVQALERAQQEWAWMGVMFLENWEPNVIATNPRWGFALKNSPTEQTLIAYNQPRKPITGFHLAQPNEDQLYTGGWRFSPEFGADISGTGDKASFTFYGTDVALRVRRADYRARFYVEIDGNPANNLPRTDDNRATLILTAADPAEDYIATELVASNLPLGEHILTLEAYRGWDQWALQGYSVAIRPPNRTYQWQMAGLGVFVLTMLAVAVYTGRQINWGQWGVENRRRWQALRERSQIALTALLALIVGVSGWLTWGTYLTGVYRKLDGLPLVGLTATAASIFYFTPSFVVYSIALVVLGIILATRPARGVALVAATLPFYITPKAMLGYRFSPVEIFIWVAFVAMVVNRGAWYVMRGKTSAQQATHFAPKLPDMAVFILFLVGTASLFFTERLDVATNEWRVIILEATLFYVTIREVRWQKRDVWLAFDAFVFSGVLVAIIGLAQVIGGVNLITSELGLLRLRSIYGSPNNVALYLGRVIPVLLALVLMGQGKRRVWYGVALLPIGLAALLTFSKGLLFLGMPASSLLIFIYWRKQQGKTAWQWVAFAAATSLILLLIALQIPPLAARLNPQGQTGFLRVNLWRASLNMALDHPIFGVGLDNFLYEYRGRYMLDVAWKEPDLNHPHNILLDFATRLGGLGLIAGIFLAYTIVRTLRQLKQNATSEWTPLAIGMIGAFTYALAHGLVDHSFFLVDMAGSCYLLLGMAVTINGWQTAGGD